MVSMANDWENHTNTRTHHRPAPATARHEYRESEMCASRKFIAHTRTHLLVEKLKRNILATDQRFSFAIYNSNGKCTRPHQRIRRALCSQPVDQIHSSRFGFILSQANMTRAIRVAQIVRRKSEKKKQKLNQSASTPPPKKTWMFCDSLSLSVHNPPAINIYINGISFTCSISKWLDSRSCTACAGTYTMHSIQRIHTQDAWPMEIGRERARWRRILGTTCDNRRRNNKTWMRSASWPSSDNTF